MHASAIVFVGALGSSDLFTHCCKIMENAWEAIQQDGHTMQCGDVVGLHQIQETMGEPESLLITIAYGSMVSSSTD